MALHLHLLKAATLVPALGAAALAVVAVKKGWVKNPLDKLAGTRVGQLLGSSDDLADAQAAMEADLQRYAANPWASPGYGYGAPAYGFGWGQQNPYFGSPAYPMLAPNLGSQWYAQPGYASLAPSWGPGQSAPAGLPQGGMTAQWTTPR